MEYLIQHAPVFTTVQFTMNADEEVIAQPDSMLSMTTGIELTGAVGKVGAKASIWGGFKSMLGGESFFRAVYRAKRDGQMLTLAPDSYGDILILPLSGLAGYSLTRGSFLASIGATQMQVTYGGVKGVMARTGLFLLQVSGEGTVFCQTFGAILERHLQPDEQFVIDNRYVIAFSTGMKYQMVKASRSISDSLMSGEGFVNKFTGPGTLYYQSRVKQVPGLLSYVLNAAT